MLNMKTIKQEEVANYPCTRRGKSIMTKDRESKVQRIKDAIIALEPGEALIIEKEDWPLKTAPRQFFSNTMKEVPKRTGTLLDKSGWIVVKL
jgi:hypothetical protein